MPVSVLCRFVVLLLAASGVRAAPAPSPPPYQLEHSAVHHLDSATLGRRYELYVKLPPGYDDPANAQHRYPVVYLNDGPYAFQAAAGVTRVTFSQHLFEEFVIVGLGYAEGEVPMESRRRDYTPGVDAAKPGASGGAAAYLGFLEREALPFVESHYRIDPARRTLAGQSYGGLFGLWVALTKPALFQNYILSSTSLWYGRRMLFQAERDYARSHRELPARLFFAVGANERPGRCADCRIDMVADQQAMVKQLGSRHYAGLSLQARVVEDAYHETTFPTALLWAMQGLFMAPPRR